MVSHGHTSGHRSTRSEREAAKAKLADGYSQARVARELGFQRKTIYNWMQNPEFREDVEDRIRTAEDQRQEFQQRLQRMSLDLMPEIQKNLKELARKGGNKELDTLLKWLDAAGNHAKHNPKQTPQQQQGSNFALLVQQLSQEEANESGSGKPVLEGEVTDESAN